MIWPSLNFACLATYSDAWHKRPKRRRMVWLNNDQYYILDEWELSMWERREDGRFG